MSKTPYAIVHIPHSSRHIPVEYREQFVIPDRALEREKRLLTDAWTDEIFDIDDDMAEVIRFPVSRLLVDPERMLDDSAEPMAAVGMGAFYSRCADGRLLRRELSWMERKKLLFRYYTPHHRTVDNAVKNALSRYGQALIIDCHSFPSSPLPCDTDRTSSRADICIGTDPFHTPQWLIDSLVEDIGCRDLSWEINRPYVGTFVPEPYYRKNSSVYSIMLELNRSLYMDEGTGRRKKGFRDFAGDIRELVDGLIAAEDNLHDRLIDEGEVIAYQDWDSGGPGAGAGQVSVCEYEGEYYILHDAGHSGPYQDMDKALRESGITVNNEATREIVFLDGIKERRA
ncbi:N-formylglutamate amidohydrolase [Candidatus Moduliflexota bacterium]